jgi:signal transduction histidine kinase
MKRTTLSEYLHRTTQGSRLILDNLHRAAELVQSFKQVAVDQTSLERRSFAVKAYIEDTLLSLRPKYKRTPHSITVNGDEEIVIESYPGAFSQVVANLVLNSIVHAYGEGEAGQLRFDLTRQEGGVLIEYSDDGRGIPPENLPKIFDPFFTTARGQGGSGLGLHIVYNLVTQKLKGTIQCDSQIGVGTKFRIKVPIE